MEKRFTLFLLGLVLSIGTAFGQAKINGTVVSQEDGEAVVGASVMVQGTTTGTVTDIDGKFSLNVPAGKKLVVSYIGMTTQTLTARDGMKVVLANDNHQLTEVVVTGMTQQDKRLFSGAATKIDASKAKLDGRRQPVARRPRRRRECPERLGNVRYGTEDSCARCHVHLRFVKAAVGSRRRHHGRHCQCRCKLPVVR